MFVGVFNSISASAELNLVADHGIVCNKITGKVESPIMLNLSLTVAQLPDHMPTIEGPLGCWLLVSRMKYSSGQTLSHRRLTKVVKMPQQAFHQ